MLMITQQWKLACNGNMLFVLDEHKAQTTDEIRRCLEQCNTEQVVIPPGTTSLVQQVDVVFNLPFKAAVEEQATQHLQENLDVYVTGQLSASERRVPNTKWVARAWETVKTNMVIRSFYKCGISLATDGSEDEEININA